MQIVDYIAIGLVLLFAVVGLISGFGGGLKFFTSGVFGFIIAIIVCIALVPTITGLEFIVNLFDGMNTKLRGVGEFGETLVLVVDYAIVGVVLFIIVQLVRMAVVAIIQHIVEVDNIVFKVINKTLGVVFYVVMLGVFVALIFSIISLIGGDTSTNFSLWLQGGAEGSGSVFKIDEAYKIVADAVQKVLNSGAATA
jgi:hypothetical protein